MSQSNELIRKIAIEEGGMPISAGARLSHIATTKQSSRIVELDFSEIPEGDRTEVLNAIREILMARSRKPISAEPVPSAAS